MDLSTNRRDPWDDYASAVYWQDTRNAASTAARALDTLAWDAAYQGKHRSSRKPSRLRRYTRIAAGTFALSFILGAALAVTGTVASASAQHTAPACDWHAVHRIDAYTTWQYVTPKLAAYEHIGRCSKVIVGSGQSVIIGQDGHVADQS